MFKAMDKEMFDNNSRFIAFSNMTLWHMPRA